MTHSWLGNMTAVLVRGLTLAAKFILMLCIARYFTTSDLGLYGLFTALVAYALFFMGVEYYNFILRQLVGVSKEEQVLIIRDQFILYLISFLLVSPVFFVLFYLNIFPYSLCLWFFIIIIVEHISNELMRILLALAKPHSSNIIFFIRQGFWVFVLLPIFYFFPSSRQFEYIFIAWIIGAVLSSVIGFIVLAYLPWTVAFRNPIRWGSLKNGLSISRPFLLSAFAALSLLYIERFFVGFYCGLDAVGIYTFYAGLSVTLHSLINSGVTKFRLAQLLQAWKQQDEQQFYKETKVMFQYTFVFILVFSLISILLIHPFVSMLHKPEYLSYVPIFYLLLLGAACRGIADVPLYTLYAQHLDKLMLRINLSSFLIMLAGNIILVPYWGLTGAAVSSCLASIVLLVYSCTMMHKRMHRTLLLQGAL